MNVLLDTRALLALARGDLSGRVRRSEESEAVQGRDGAVRPDPVHRLESRQNVDAEDEQPCHIAQHEMNLEDCFWRHVTSSFRSSNGTNRYHHAGYGTMQYQQCQKAT
jgi:hypothetical protein